MVICYFVSAAVTVDSSHMTASSSASWSRFSPEMVHQRPCMMREIETRLSDSRVGNNSVVDHRSPSSLHCIIVSTDVMSDHVGIKMQAVEVDAQGRQHTQANLDWLRWFEAYCQLPFYDVEKKVQLLSTGSYESCVGCRQPEVRRIELWSQVSMRFV